ncbi:isochorismatase family protein [Nocardiopsis exhalans]|uniref:Isochorismatase family protein n=1 Tax=Nocardiopsis exhalans TaxID=163604 RepID=A0ABY5D534_9ACTN|nr:isochorismatase family protein [Nocardiopsis exhalans]USY18846.1 isochorismatase family protein [Nocardiopsis exhalans]
MNPTRTGRALVVVDAQQSFLQRESWQASSGPGVADRIGHLVDHFRGRGGRGVWVLHTEPGSGTVFDPELGFVEPMPGLNPADGEPLLTKTAHSAFTGTDLRRLLTGWGVTEATGLTPLRYQQRLRLERAEQLIGEGATMESAARTVGFQDARMLRRLRSNP